MHLGSLFLKLLCLTSLSFKLLYLHLQLFIFFLSLFQSLVSFNTDITLCFYHFIFEKHLLSIHYLFFPNCTKKILLHTYLQPILGFESMVRVLGLFAVETYVGNIFAKCESIYSVKKYCFGNQVIILNSSNTLINKCVVYLL